MKGSGSPPQFAEWFTSSYGQVFRIKKTLFYMRSPYQEIFLFENSQWGRILVLDGAVQLSEGDEFFYHESLVHPVMTLHPDPKKILVIGGGDGGSIREILRYPVERVYLVELDEWVVHASKKYLFSVHQNSFNHPRVRIFIQEGMQFIQHCKDLYDVIVLDLPDPVGAAEKLAGREFFQLIRHHLHPDGCVSLQAGSPLIRREYFERWKKAVQETFPHFLVYLAPVPTFPGGLWAFFLAGQQVIPSKPYRAPPATKYWRKELLPSIFHPPLFLFSSQNFTDLDGKENF
ncbi:MAG: polyamine aminopropyltransferase [bacterium JZ-2024 1]